MPAREPRALFKGNADVIAAVLDPFVTSIRWLQYGEAKNARVNPKVIKTHAIMMIALKHVQSNWSFPQKKVETAMLQLFTAKGFILKEDQKRDWVVTCAKRLRLMCRHCSQAYLHDVQWATNMFGKADLGAAPLTNHGDGEAATTDHEYLVGFDRELLQAWRVQADVKDGRREYATRMVLRSASCQDEDPVVAVWQDGWQHEVSSYTAAEFRAWQAAVHPVPENKKCWEAVAPDGMRLHLTVKKDRNPGGLTVLMKGDVQLFMVRNDLFQGGAEEAAFFVGDLGHKWAAGTITSKEELYEIRDRRFPKKSVKKRPASVCPLQEQAASSQHRPEQPVVQAEQQAEQPVHPPPRSFSEELDFMFSKPPPLSFTEQMEAMIF